MYMFWRLSSCFQKTNKQKEYNACSSWREQLNLYTTGRYMYLLPVYNSSLYYFQTCHNQASSQRTFFWSQGCMFEGYIYSISSIWCKNMLGYLSAYMYMICSEKWTVFQEQCFKKIVSFKDMIMCKDKYLSIFLRQMGAFVFLFLQILFTTHQVMLKLGISLGYCPVLAGT